MNGSTPLSRRARFVLIGLALTLAAGLGARLAFGGGTVDADDAPPPPPEARLEKGAGAIPTLVLAPGQAQALGLETAAAVATTEAEALPIHGQVLDPLPFLDLDARRRATVAALRAAQSASAAAEAELSRITALHGSDRGASDKALQEARRAAAEAASQRISAQADAVRAQAAWTQAGLDSIEGFAEFRRVPVRLDLPLGMPAPSPLPRTLGATSPALAGALPLKVLGLAPGGSPLTGGLALLALAPGKGLRPGLPVDSALAGPAGTRLRIPRAAVVWSGSQAQVFIQTGEGRFQPRSVTIAFPGEAGLVLGGGLAPGDRVVVKGALELQGEYGRLAEGAAIGAGGV